MKTGYRVFVVENDSVKSIPQKKFDGFYLRQVALPEYAGMTLVIALVTYELEGRVPKRIVKSDTIKVKVTTAGKVDQKYSIDGISCAMARFDPTKSPEERRLALAEWKDRHPPISDSAYAQIESVLFRVAA